MTKRTCYLCAVAKNPALDPNATPFNPCKHMVCILHAAALYWLSADSTFAFDFGGRTIAVSQWPLKNPPIIVCYRLRSLKPVITEFTSKRKAVAFIRAVHEEFPTAEILCTPPEIMPKLKH